MSLVTPRQQPPADASASSPRSEATPLTVMIVDDDAEWRQTLKTWLDREGFRTVALARADWIMPAIELHQPDVVVLDVQLPGPLSGLDLLDTLGRRWPGLSTIVTTAFGGAPVADTARRLGASAYIDKPFRISALVDVIRRVRPPART
jgi:DNA-binding NtrC family response regulator